MEELQKLNDGKEKEDLRTIRTRAFLSNALISLLEKENIEKISIIDICDKAMVHRTTFYKHFNDKYDLFCYVFDNFKQEIFDKATKNTVNSTPKEKYLNVANAAFDFIDENRENLLNILKHNTNEMILGILYGSTERAIKQLLEEHRDKNKLPINVAASFYTGGFASIAIWWLANPKAYSKEQMLCFIDELISENICSCE